MTVSTKHKVILSRCKKFCNDKHLRRIVVKNHDGTFFQCTYCNRVYVVIPHIETYAQGDVLVSVFKCIDKTFRSEDSDEKFFILLDEKEVNIPMRL